MPLGIAVAVDDGVGVTVAVVGGDVVIAVAVEVDDGVAALVARSVAVGARIARAVDVAVGAPVAVGVAARPVPSSEHEHRKTVAVKPQTDRADRSRSAVIIRRDSTSSQVLVAATFRSPWRGAAAP